MAATVLVVDDEPNLVELVHDYLVHEGFAVLTAGDGPSALQTARARRPDVLVLDVMLPGLDGIELCRTIRGFSDAYVLMLTARAEEIDKVVGLSVGADDYLTKPFSPRELVARVKAMLRRPRSGAPQAPEPAAIRHIGDLVLDEGTQEVTRGGDPLALTPREFRLLAMFAAHPGRVFTRDQLLERVWGNEYYDDHVVVVHVANLRKKVERDPARPEYIQTVRGVGYRLAARTE